jgi:hypothetical protein
MTRVWLARWEWACCGDAFEVGDDVDFGIATRHPDETLAEELGPALFSTLDALESHHENEYTDRAKGTVVAVHAVTHEVTERRIPRPLRPSSSVERTRPPVRDLGNGIFVGTDVSPDVVMIESVPGTVRLASVRGVGRREEREDDTAATTRAAGPSPTEQRTRSVLGWIVDVDEQNPEEAQADA